ncbi:serine protease [Aquibacillus koreensis]|uniref:Serine protease n=1 Tax=Aquibacillus koreensis TaxID=279446 RepID=A0A9X4AI03_9BACI|nr:serine protease [Aquibacillus koreensis]MCT2535778.1 serine protease [Aquibacillus koreensis]MDC3420234.1 serine protease [Aquibacillus koreensis]
MKESDNYHQDIIDEDLYEEIDHEELIEILKVERENALQKEKEEKHEVKRPFPKWAFWLIAIAMLINVVAILPRTFSIPAIDFLVTSAQLMTDPTIDEYQESVVVVQLPESKGTGFSISPDGLIITNHHVIEAEKIITVAYPEQGLYDAEVIHEFPDIDLAVLQVKGNDLPYLPLANDSSFSDHEHIHFIGNPLQFNGIANEGELIGYTDLKEWDQEVIMMKAPVYRGNSGSPVINSDGEVIGVIFATLKHDTHGKVGLAVPIDYYHEKMNE